LRRLLGIVSVVAAIAAAAPAWSLEVPPRPTGRVSDYAGVLSTGERTSLENRLAEIERETSSQYLVALFESLGGDDLEGFSMRLAEAWQPGTAERDNGLIILVFTRDRRIRMEVGKGLEGAIPDILAGRIIRDVIGPRFRSGDYAGGLAAAIEAVHLAARGEYTPPAPRRDSPPPWLVALLLLGVVGLVIFIRLVGRYGGTAMYGGRHQGPWGTGGFGGGGFPGGGGLGGFSGGGGDFGGGGASGSW
jgi:uncharacterized protein